MERDISGQIKKKHIHKYQFSRKSFQWEPSRFMCTDGRTDRHHEANSRSSQFFEREWKRRV